jgi:M6 family metalloprotease-like protein
MAVPACPEGAKVTQPDGTEITIYLRGDEYRHWHESKDGFLIAKSAKSGEWVYMVKEAGAAVASSHAVGKADPGTSGALMPNKEKLSAEAALSRTEKLAAGEGTALAPPTGTMCNLVVLVNFSDLTVAYPRQSYDDLFNQVGYIADGAVGSVKDYYYEVSYNTLTVQSTVVEAVTLDYGYAYYGANDIYGNDIRPREMVAEALAKLEARGFDFSTVDGDMDGWVDGLTIIHAGGGEEYSGNNVNYIWSHQWALSSPVTYDGVLMQMYHTEPARRGWDSSPSTQGITRIGVICHETGHFLGLPDLYDYGYDSEGAGNFCLMAGGSWNGDYGTTPAHTSAWCKSSLGWISPTLISSSGVYSLGQAETNAQVYKLQGTFPSTQYFLVENRQGVGFDAAIPGSHRGILIWHVDEMQADNDDQTHYKVDLEEASGTQHLALNLNAGDDADYFRAGNATVFTGSSTPNNLSYAGQPLKVNITDVGASGANMSVSVDCPIVVEIMGSWVTGTTHAKEAGANRALVFVAHAESSSSSTSLTGVTYGGRSMTKITDKIIGSSSSQAYVAAFILNESDIVAATNTTFTPTWTSAPGSITYTSVFLQNVNQTTLVGATANNGVTNSKSISISSSLATSNGDMVIEDAASSVTGTYTVTTGWTKDVDLSVSGYDGMDGHKFATGASETPSVSQSRGNHVLIGFVVKVAPAGQYTLTINTVGNGSVAKSPDKTTYTYGEVVTLTATADAGWTFSTWSSDLTGSTNPTTITMNGSKSVTATFTQNEYALTLNKVGSGSVTADPVKSTYHYGDSVQLTATADAGWTFSTWDGGLGATNPVAITIDGDKTVTATFTQNEYALTLNKVGSGSVTADPVKAAYHYGDSVQLTATADAGWTFSTWSGDLTGSTNPTTITMNGSKSVTATFTQNEYALTLNKVGSGSVTADPVKAAYHYGDSVQLTATADAGWTFSTWDGGLGTANPVALTIEGGRTVTATFTQNEYTLTLNKVGSGSVAADPAKGTYHYGDSVQLTATADAGWTFSTWSGDLSGSDNPATLTIDGNKSVAANFEWAPAWTLSDNFNDGLKSAMWFRSIDDYDNVWVTEDANSLNLRSIGEVTEPGNYAGYAANGWTYDVSEDFTARVDFHYSAVDSYNGWIGITVGNNDANYVSILVGSEDKQAYLYYEKVVDANVVSSDRIIRTSNDGTLYISYSAAADELYVSTVGYGAANAWQTAVGLLQGQWVSGTVYVSIGGGGVCDGIAAGGQARLDNFETAAGKIVGWPPATDLDSDGFIGLGDFIILAENWLSPGPATDFNGDGIVDMRDFDRLALAW